ncbi:unnamed protein product [Meloidogyne enterolobii]|uniref:Uncharacterized protein n=1 Tax=Meloidogyne enterolobii TaxID=390850 RepID=A0ACB1BBI8_MELEN
MHLQEIANIATKPSPEAYVKQQLKEICIAYNGPILTLMRIKVMTVDNCEWPSSENEKLLNRAIDLF